MEVEKEFFEYVININKVTKVVKGGRRFRFNALVAVGNKNGKVGLGYGKSKEVPDAVRKAIERAKKDMFFVPIVENGTIPHEIKTKSGASIVILKPGQPGSGIIAGDTARAILEACGIKDVVTKSIRSTNKHNLSKAVIKALKLLRSKDQIMSARGLKEG